MIINQWYVAAEATEVTAQAPRKVKMLGLDFVLSRDEAGVAHCLSDICVHRGASLGLGPAGAASAGFIALLAARTIRKMTKATIRKLMKAVRNLP